jgi:hypothetical protein
MYGQVTEVTDISPQEGGKCLKGPKRRNLEQHAADCALYERLRLRDFDPDHWEMKHLRDDLWVYGWRCLRAWMRDGTIIEKCGERGVPLGARYFEVEVLQRRGDIRDEIAHTSVESAVQRFTEEFLPGGKWEPEGGATMRTYFVKTCLYAFRDVFKNWFFSYRRRLFAAADVIAAEPYEGIFGPVYVRSPDDAFVLQDTIQRILEGAGPEVRAICGLIWESKVTQKAIGAELGMTSRMVEGYMARLRARAKVMASRGEIEALYGRAAARKAVGR